MTGSADTGTNPTFPEDQRRSAALGLFVLVQMVFLVLANFLPFVQTAAPHLPEPGRRVLAALDATPRQGNGSGAGLPVLDAVRFWEDLTGQEQNWSLFAPEVSRRCGFPLVLLRWDEPPTHPTVAARIAALFGFESAPGRAAAFGSLRPDLHARFLETELAARILAPLAASHGLEGLTFRIEDLFPAQRPLVPWPVASPNQPHDLEAYFRLGGFRLRRFEGVLLPALEEQTRPEALRATVRDHVHRHRELVRGYLRWRLHDLEANSPCRWNPRSLVLAGRYVSIREPGAKGLPWNETWIVPLARWTVPQPGEAGPGLLEWYDPLAATFVPCPP